MTHLKFTAILAAGFVWLLLAAPGSAQSTAADGSRGQMLFKFHCASCHGLAGSGDGPVSEHLREPAPDLTGLASDRGGKFPRQEVYRAIDGRDEVPTHGTREMPVWGISLKQPGSDANQESEVSASIWDLVNFIESIQKP